MYWNQRASEETAAGCSLSLAARKKGKSPLLAEDKYARLAGKTDFLDLAILADEHRIVTGFGAAVFPAAFGFGNHFAALLNGGFVAVDQQAIFAGLQLGLTELSGLGEADILGKRLGENRHRQRDDSEQSNEAEERIFCHTCQ